MHETGGTHNCFVFSCCVTNVSLYVVCRRQLSKAATNKVKAIAAMDPEPQPNNQPGLGELPPIERVREELAITFAYVSDFLRKVCRRWNIALL
jgi:hypothetical protein